MGIKKLRDAAQEHRRLLIWLLAALAVVSWLLLYKLGSLVGGLSRGEVTVATTPLGWHGMYQQPLELPLKLVRSAVFFVFPDHGQTLTRLPNVLFGALAIISFGGLVRLWHGRRTAGLRCHVAMAPRKLHAAVLLVECLSVALPTLVCSHFL